MNEDYTKADALIAKMFDSLTAEKAGEASRFIRSWNDLVGDRIASHSRVLDVYHRVLIVEVDHPGWSQLIHIQKNKIMCGLKQKFPNIEICSISVRIRSGTGGEYQRLKSEVEIESIDTEEDKNTENFHISVSPDLPEDLKAALDRLKNSIKKGRGNYNFLS